MSKKLAFAVSIVLFGCGGGGSSSPTLPSGPSSPLSLVPASVTMSAVGSSQVFTASGGDGYNYVASEVLPLDSFRTDVIGVNPYRVQVTMTRRPGINSTRLVVDGVVGGQIRSVIATINIM